MDKINHKYIPGMKPTYLQKINDEWTELYSPKDIMRHMIRIFMVKRTELKFSQSDIDNGFLQGMLWLINRMDCVDKKELIKPHQPMDFKFYEDVVEYAKDTDII